MSCCLLECEYYVVVFPMFNESLLVLNQSESCFRSSFMLLKSVCMSWPVVYIVVSSANIMHLFFMALFRSIVSKALERSRNTPMVLSRLSRDLRVSLQNKLTASVVV